MTPISSTRSSTAELNAERSYKVSNLLSFRNKEICRASRVVDILKTAGSIFADSGGSAATYALSEQVEGIHAFISHNWSVSRWHKFIILAMHFNYVPAVTASFTVMLSLFVLTATGVLPGYDYNGAGMGMGKGAGPGNPGAGAGKGAGKGAGPAPPSQKGDNSSGIWGQALSAPVFIFVLFTWHEIHRRLCLRLRSPYVFLDKTCIHQTDAALKKEGILKLGAFLDKSYKMVIIYTDVYLKKLWTVYEVASFLCLHPVHDMLLYPVQFAFAALCFIGLCYVCMLSQWILVLLGTHLEHIAVLVVSLSSHVLLRAWSYIQAGVHRHIHEFDVRNTVCFCEDDRLLVYANIADFMQHFDIVNSHATQDQALNAFNELVQRALPGAIDKSLGSVGLRYGWVSIAFILTILPKGMDRLAARVSNMPDLNAQDVFIDLLSVITLAFFVCPLYVAAASVTSRQFLYKGKLCDCLWVVIGFLTTTAMAFGWLATIKKLRSDIHDEGTRLVLIIGCQLLLATFTLFSYSTTVQKCIRSLICRKGAPVADVREFLRTLKAKKHRNFITADTWKLGSPEAEECENFTIAVASEADRTKLLREDFVLSERAEIQIGIGRTHTSI